MARINARALTEAAIVAHRVNLVRQDPAVVKAAKLAGADIAEAGRSTAKLLQEVHFAWRRTAS